jgi:hypothetical protein
VDRREDFSGGLARNDFFKKMAVLEIALGACKAGWNGTQIDALSRFGHSFSILGDCTLVNQIGGTTWEFERGGSKSEMEARRKGTRVEAVSHRERIEPF